MGWLRPRTWWHAGLLWGTAMFLYYSVKASLHGDLTLLRAARLFAVWEAGGPTFGIVLTGAMSPLWRKNLFRGFPDKRGGR